MIAVILAAGVSSRLRPYTDALPKSLLPIAGKPLLQRTLEALQQSPISECVIVTGYHRELVKRFVQGLHLPLQTTYVLNPVYATTNNNYSLWLAGPTVRGHNLLLLDADILFDQRILWRLLESPHENALVVRRSEDLGKEEVKTELDADGRVVHIGKDVSSHRASGESLGLEKFSQQGADRLFAVLDRRKDRHEFYEASFQELIDAGTDIYAVDAGGYLCMEIDTPDDLEAATRLAQAMDT